MEAGCGVMSTESPGRNRLAPFFVPNRAHHESNGQDPEFGEQTFDIRVHVRDAFPKSLQIHHK